MTTPSFTNQSILQLFGLGHMRNITRLSLECTAMAYPQLTITTLLTNLRETEQTFRLIAEPRRPDIDPAAAEPGRLDIDRLAAEAMAAVHAHINRIVARTRRELGL